MTAVELDSGGVVWGNIGCGSIEVDYGVGCD